MLFEKKKKKENLAIFDPPLGFLHHACVSMSITRLNMWTVSLLKRKQKRIEFLIFFTSMLRRGAKPQYPEKSSKIIKNHQKSSKKHIILLQLASRAASDLGNDVMDGHQHEIEHVEGIFEKKSKLRFLEALRFSQKDIKLLDFYSHLSKIEEYEQNEQKFEIWFGYLQWAYDLHTPRILCYWLVLKNLQV